jgi:hypothetical protein
MSAERRWSWQEHLHFLCSAAMPAAIEIGNWPEQLGPCRKGDWLPRVNMAPAHWADLYETSGLVPAIIQEQMIRSVPPNIIRPLLGFDVSGVHSAMLLPFFALDKDTTLLDFVRVKVFPPLCDSEGHTTKYLQRRGTPPRLYVVRRVAQAVRESTTPLYLVEGEKKVLAVAQLGHAVVGFLGIEGWHVKGSRELLPDFDQIPLAGRTVELLPDGDIQTNDNVARGVEHFARALLLRGARVTVKLLPLSVTDAA